MLRNFFVFIIFAISLYGGSKVEIYATNMESEGSVVKAYNGVSVIYKDYFLTSQRAVYDRNSSTLELFGDVRATKNKNYKLLGKYAKLDLAKKEKVFRPFFMLEKKSQVWMSADEGCSSQKDYNIESGVLSGCDPNDPLWQLEFSSSDYNSDDMWLSLYNARIYIYDIPVIYTPYFGFSLDTTRRTGLLMPSLGISDKEGFYYEQPIYIAEQNWWDLELKPQIRTNRGYGGYATFRFVDSPTSKGEFTTGYFQEKQNYFEDENLLNDTHYGFNFRYDNSNFINDWFKTSLSGQSGIYADINNMNDVDYINLSTNDTTQNTTASQVLSRLNMFYNNEDDYVGIYFKYYKDLTQKNNDEIFQQLPSLQYHHYLDSFFDDHFFYNVDIKSNNIVRNVDKKALQSDLNLPLTLQSALFDEYLNLSYTAYMYAQHSSFSGNSTQTDAEFDDGVYAREYNIVNISSELTRAYSEFTHVVDIGMSYVFSGADTKSGYYDYNNEFCSDPINKNDPRCEFYNITDVDEAVSIGFSQYIFNSLGEQKLYHKVSQRVFYKNKENKLGELENELDYQVTKNIKYYNNMFYNYDEHKFSKILNKLSFSGGGFSLSLSHLFKDSFLPRTDDYTPYTSYLTSSINYAYNEHYSYFAKLDYDLEQKFKKSSQIGFLYQKRCWEFGLKFLENTRPIITKSGTDSIDDRYLYFTVLLKPLMSTGSASSNFALRLPETLQED